MRVVAFIPSRAGSKRVPGKATRMLGDKPVIQWTIDAAMDSAVFDDIYVCSDDEWALTIADLCGVGRVLRPTIPDSQRDIEWVTWLLPKLHQRPDAFAILRPTSPFRTAKNLVAAWADLMQCGDCVDSLRAVRRVTEHPGKMWTFEHTGKPIKPYLNEWLDGTPWHSCPSQALPRLYVQTSSLEFAWTRVVETMGSISGKKIGAFFHDDPWESLSIDHETDWILAEHHAAELLAARQATPSAQ